MKVLARLAAVSLAALALACGDNGDINDPDPQSIAGTYTLRTVNDEPLPIVIIDMEGYRLEITAANYVLTGSGTYSNTVSYRETEDGQTTTGSETFTGVFTVAGSNVTFTDSDGDVIVGLISGNTLRFTDEGVTAVFSR